MWCRVIADTIPGQPAMPRRRAATVGTGPTKKGVAMRVRPLLRAGGVVGAAAFALGVVAPVSHAEPTEVSFFSGSWGVGFDNIVTGVDPTDPLVLFAGASLDERCAEEGGTPATGRSRSKGDEEVQTLVDRGPLWVYDAGGMPFIEFTQKYCLGEISDPELVAVGEGTIRFRVEIAYSDTAPPDIYVYNTVNGSVRTADGDNWAVNAHAELTVDPTPNPVSVSFTIRNER